MYWARTVCQALYLVLYGCSREQDVQNPALLGSSSSTWLFNVEGQITSSWTFSLSFCTHPFRDVVRQSRLSIQSSIHWLTDADFHPRAGWPVVHLSSQQMTNLARGKWNLKSSHSLPKPVPSCLSHLCTQQRTQLKRRRHRRFLHPTSYWLYSPES